jgi:hypothetical protein
MEKGRFTKRSRVWLHEDGTLCLGTTSTKIARPLQVPCWLFLHMQYVADSYMNSSEYCKADIFENFNFK